ncbi:MAG TPA: sigma-70 family RNA polymerase sigma factor [Aggregatilineales bacterium]|jgi:RNA polymerase sigma-70 factor, ECF subfamily|nr:sigma-70 family RNA polymerase sigma factor [Anaerolineae bacterium]HUN05344.1 sigma-70 family RNA polymerase sigma factor [Aggregatilineales bacterium]
MIDPTTTAAVEAALQGDQEAFADLVYAFQDAVYNLCYRMLGDRGEAEDAAQEAFLRAYLNLKRYDQQRPFKTWLLSIASNYCIDRLRRRRLQWLSLDDEPDEEGTSLSLPSDEPEPEHVALSREHSRLIQSLLGELSPDYRAAVVLRYWYDYSYTEIAEITGTTESAVKSRLFRARQALAEKMDGRSSTARLTNPLWEGS